MTKISEATTKLDSGTVNLTQDFIPIGRIGSEESMAISLQNLVALIGEKSYIVDGDTKLQVYEGVNGYANFTVDDILRLKFTKDSIIPASNNSYNIGSFDYKIKDIHIAGKILVGSDATGDLYYNDGTKLARLAIGANDKVLGVTTGALSWVSRLSDSPADGNIYARKDGAWIPIELGETYTFKYSLSETSGEVNLVNDSDTPGNSKYYGTNSGGTKGWFDLPTGGIVSVNWGDIGGTLSNQTDLSLALAAKEDTISTDSGDKYFYRDKTWKQVAYSEISGVPDLTALSYWVSYSSGIETDEGLIAIRAVESTEARDIEIGYDKFGYDLSIYGIVNTSDNLLIGYLPLTSTYNIGGDHDAAFVSIKDSILTVNENSNESQIKTFALVNPNYGNTFYEPTDNIPHVYLGAAGEIHIIGKDMHIASSNTATPSYLSINSNVVIKLNTRDKEALTTVLGTDGTKVIERDWADFVIDLGISSTGYWTEWSTNGLSTDKEIAKVTGISGLNVIDYVFGYDSVNSLIVQTGNLGTTEYNFAYIDLTEGSDAIYYGGTIANPIMQLTGRELIMMGIDSTVSTWRLKNPNVAYNVSGIYMQDDFTIITYGEVTFSLANGSTENTVDFQSGVKVKLTNRTDATLTHVLGLNSSNEIIKRTWASFVSDIGGGSGVSKFLDLRDVLETSYAGHLEYLLAVNDAGTGIEFVPSLSFSQIRTISAKTLLGRYTNSTGSIQQITIGSNLTLSDAGVLSASGSGGISYFYELADVSSYTSHANKYVKVNSTSDGIEYGIPEGTATSITSSILSIGGSGFSRTISPYSSKTADAFYTGTTTPTGKGRLNYDGTLWATSLYTPGVQILDTLISTNFFKLQLSGTKYAYIGDYDLEEYGYVFKVLGLDTHGKAFAFQVDGDIGLRISTDTKVVTIDDFGFLSYRPFSDFVSSGVTMELTGAISGSGASPITTSYSAIVPVNKGGTGYSSYSVGNILVANTTTSFSKVSPSSTNQSNPSYLIQYLNSETGIRYTGWDSNKITPGVGDGWQFGSSTDYIVGKGQIIITGAGGTNYWSLVAGTNNIVNNNSGTIAIKNNLIPDGTASIGTSILRFNTVYTSNLDVSSSIYLDNYLYLGGGTTYYINGSSQGKLSKLALGGADISTTYTLNVTGSIYASGDIYFLSDERYKYDIRDLELQLSKINKLRAVRYKWIENDESDFGLIAQEVEKIFPELVSTNEHGYKSVNYTKLSIFLLKALQELNNE